eukprot:747607-Hanusia_phi.AAC.4
MDWKRVCRGGGQVALPHGSSCVVEMRAEISEARNSRSNREEEQLPPHQDERCYQSAEKETTIEVQLVATKAGAEQ